jgi:galactofuranose transport system ATP-binding protein
MENNDDIVEMRDIDMFFPGVRALEGVNFSLKRGEIHSLMGENGAGKSTLIKILTGVYKRSGGTIMYNGAEFSPSTPLAAQNAGINTVYQEVNLCDNLSVAENIYAGRQIKKFGIIDWRSIQQHAAEALAKLNIHIDVTRLLGTYSVAMKQMVAIARAVDMSSKVLILDEPTSSLDKNEVEQLFTTMRQLKAQGMAIIFISHFLDQIYAVCDRVTVLRNGNLIGEYNVSELSKIELVSKMVGKEMCDLNETARASDTSSASHEIVIEAKNVGKKHFVNPFSLLLKRGEITGFAGLLGSGRTETADLLFGVDEADEGELFMNGKKLTLRSPRDAIHAGIAFCPEDRKKDGLFYDLSVRENIIMAIQAKLGIFHYIPMKRQIETAKVYIDMLGIATPSTEQAVKNLSGGNQQKVILARWLVTEPEVLILDEPTRGIDVKAKAEIMNLTMKLCHKGLSIVFISSEMEEVLRCSDRIVVMRDRSKIVELEGAEKDEARIMEKIAGGQNT